MCRDRTLCVWNPLWQTFPFHDIAGANEPVSLSFSAPFIRELSEFSRQIWIILYRLYISDVYKLKQGHVGEKFCEGGGDDR